MKLKKLIIQGFKSFIEPQVIDFTKYDSELVFVSGENKVEPKLGANGVGKSTLLSDSLSWVLFGKTSVNLKASDIHTWNNDKPTKISLWFDDYVLERTWSPNTLLLNSSIVTQEELENIIGMNFNSFQYSVLISQFSSKFVDLSPTQRLEVFTEIMEDILSNWDIYRDKAKSESETKKEEIDTLKLEISRLEGELKSHNPEDLVRASKEFEEERKTKISVLKKELDSINIKELEEEIKNYEITTLNLGIEAATLLEEKKSLEEFKEEEQNKKIEHETTLSIIEAQITTADEHLRLLRKADSACPTCGHKMKDKEKNCRAALLSANINLMAKDLEKVLHLVTESKSKIRDINDAISKVSEEYRIKINKASEINMEINRKIRKVDQISSTYSSTLKELNSWIEAVNPFKSPISEAKHKANHTKRVLLHKKDALEATKKEFEILKYWTKGFKDIKLMLTSESLLEFQIEINNNLQKLGMSNWEIKLDVDTETKSGSLKRGFSILVKSPINDKPVPFECWSGGEGQRIRMAVTLGLSDFIKNRRGATCDVMVFDEPSQHLSEEGINDLLESLNAKAKNDRLKIFFIDHRSLETSNWFDAVIKVTKTENGSEVTQ